MPKLSLNHFEQRAISEVIEGDASDPVDLVRRAGLDRSRFFEDSDWSDVDFSKSDLNGVSFRNSNLDGACFTKSQSWKIILLYQPDHIITKQDHFQLPPAKLIIMNIVGKETTLLFRKLLGDLSSNIPLEIPLRARLLLFLLSILPPEVATQNVLSGLLWEYPLDVQRGRLRNLLTLVRHSFGDLVKISTRTINLNCENSVSEVIFDIEGHQYQCVAGVFIEKYFGVEFWKNEEFRDWINGLKSVQINLQND